jgi:pyruvate/2-oxoglutarate dehydrogenase complex dihydrolipoamide acyltransferase (E2) component
MEEGVLSLWLKHEGDAVHKGDALAEIETDKATMELEAYEDGVLEQVLVSEGTTVPIGGRLAVIGDGSGSGARAGAEGGADAAVAQTGATPQPTADETAPPTAPSSPTADVATAREATQESPGTASAATAAPTSGPVRTSPLARRIAKENGIDLAQVQGTGPGGRIVRADVEDAVAQRGQAAQPATAAPASTPPASATPSAAAAVAAPVAQPREGDEVVPLNAVRRITAERLTQSAAAPQFYLTALVEADRLLALRSEVNAGLASRASEGGAVKVSVTDLLVRVCALVLRQHPEVNASWGGDATVVADAVVAVDAPGRAGCPPPAGCEVLSGCTVRPACDTAASTSARTMRPPGPVPVTVARSMPCSLAMRRARGDVGTRPGGVDGVAGADAASGACPVTSSAAATSLVGLDGAVAEAASAEVGAGVAPVVAGWSCGEPLPDPSPITASRPPMGTVVPSATITCSSTPSS